MYPVCYIIVKTQSLEFQSQVQQSTVQRVDEGFNRTMKQSLMLHRGEVSTGLAEWDRNRPNLTPTFGNIAK